uniref:Uncharacterized protein LOC114342856 n=1 Tax=Diabrotica virgifera virgifera TaxID=50390 RepID=A0A6P7GTV1_DIAVI
DSAAETTTASISTQTLTSTTNQPETSQSNQTPTTLSHQSTFSQHTESKLPNLNTEVTENKETHLKRSISEVASPETDITLQENPFVVPKPTATRKKPKTSKLEETTHSNVSIFGMIYPAKTFINNHEPPFPLDCDQLVLHLESIAGLSNPIISINDYTSDLRGLSWLVVLVRVCVGIDAVAVSAAESATVVVFEVIELSGVCCVADIFVGSVQAAATCPGFLHLKQTFPS